MSCYTHLQEGLSVILFVYFLLPNIHSVFLPETVWFHCHLDLIKLPDLFLSQQLSHLIEWTRLDWMQEHSCDALGFRSAPTVAGCHVSEERGREEDVDDDEVVVVVEEK